jgi:hypothetical protein
MKHRDGFAKFGKDLLLQAFHEVHNTDIKVFDGSPAMGPEMSKFIVKQAKANGLPEPKWNGVAWVIPED